MRKPKPFFRQFTQSWYVTIRGKQINLGPDHDAALARYDELMAQHSLSPVIFTSVAELLNRHLSWLKQNRAAGTYKKANGYLLNFSEYVGPKQSIERLLPIHLIHWVESHANWSPTTRHDAISTVQRAFSWAAKRQYIQTSPITIVPDKPSRRRREVVYTPGEWDAIRAAVSDQSFGDLLDFLRYTGCRPLEARTLCNHHVDLANSVAVFPPSESKGQQTERVLYLPEQALDIVERRCHILPTGVLFRNSKGNPWTKDSIKCRFGRISKSLGRRVCAYGIRHTYATESLKKGIDSLTLAQIMGHSDTSMLARHYAHLARNPIYLKQQAERAIQ